MFAISQSIGPMCLDISAVKTKATENDKKKNALGINV